MNTEIIEQRQEPLSATSEMVISRQAQEVQAAMVVAKRFPRNTIESRNRIIDACKRKSLAEQSMYTYPKGNKTVTGPSIRLAEVLAQNWGNVDFGVVELDQRGDESTVMTYAWDLETNTRQTKIFQVKHLIHTKAGAKRLTDPRDVYELAANQGARRLRACILGIIPGDIVDDAVDQCEKTLSGDNSVPLADRIRKMAARFSGVGVNVQQIEGRLGHKIESTSEHEMVVLHGIFKSLADGMSGVADHFQVAASSGGKGSESVLNKLRAKTTPEPPPPENVDTTTGEVTSAPPPDDDIPFEAPAATTPEPPTEPVAEADQAPPVWKLAELSDAQDGDWARTAGIVESIVARGTADKPYKTVTLWDGPAKRQFSVWDKSADDIPTGKRVDMTWRCKVKNGKTYFNGEDVQVTE